MERFKSFFKKYPETKLIVAGVGMIAVGLALNHYVNGFTVKSADHFTRADGTSVINAYLKNGQTICLIKTTS